MHTPRRGLTGPPEHKEKEDKVVVQRPCRRHVPWQHIGQRVEHEHRLGSSAERVQDVEECVPDAGESKQAA